MKNISIITLLATMLVATNGLTAKEKDAKRERPTPESIVAEMITEYDANEDNSLDETELVAALQGMREKHPHHRKKRWNAEAEEHIQNERDPAVHAQHIIARFDNSNDQALDTEELLALVDSMHKRRGPRPDHEPSTEVE